MSGAGDRLPLPESRQLSDPGMRATRGGVREAAEQRPGSSESQENPALPHADNFSRETHELATRTSAPRSRCRIWEDECSMGCASQSFAFLVLFCHIIREQMLFESSKRRVGPQNLQPTERNLKEEQFERNPHFVCAVLLTHYLLLCSCPIDDFKARVNKIPMPRRKKFLSHPKHLD